MRVSLGSGFEFTTGTLPASTDLSLNVAAGGAIAVTKVAGGADGDTSVAFLVDITTSFTGRSTFTLTTTGWTLRDVNNLLAEGGIATITVKTFNAADNIEFDSGTDTVDWLNIAGGCPIPPANNPPEVNNPGSQATTEGDSVSLRIQASDPDGDSLTYSANGLPPGLSINSSTGLISGTLGLDTAGTYSVRVSVSDGTLTRSVDFAWVVAEETVLIAIFMNGNNAFLNSRVYLWNPSESAGSITVKAYTLPRSGPSTLLGSAALGLLDARSSRNIKIAEDVLSAFGIPLPYTADGGNLTVEFTIGADKVQGVAQVFSDSLAFGTYPLQEISPTVNASPTILTANFMNGNNAFLNSRVYLWNPSDDAGDITAKVYTLTLSGPSTLLGTVNLGLLNARSARNIRIAESILALLDIPLPYTNDGGNLTVEFTIGAENVQGTAQVFSDSLAFGTYPMQVIQ